jgi:hypothetical protein
MKTFYGISLFLLCFIVSYSDILAVDVTIKTNLMRTRTETVSAGATSASCGGGAPAAPQVFTFDVTVVDSVTTQFTVRVVEKDNTSNVIEGPSTHNIVNGVNYNLATGELTHTITGIPPSKKVLVVELYKGNTVGGSPYFSQEITTRSETGPGVLTIGDVGDGTSVSGEAGIIIGGSKSNPNASSSEITVDIKEQVDAEYIVLLTIDSPTTGVRQENSQIRTPVIYDKSATSFKVYLYDPTASVQNIRLNVVIQSY